MTTEEQIAFAGVELLRRHILGLARAKHGKGAQVDVTYGGEYTPGLTWHVTVPKVNEHHTEMRLVADGVDLTEIMRALKDGTA